MIYNIIIGMHLAPINIRIRVEISISNELPPSSVFIMGVPCCQHVRSITPVQLQLQLNVFMLEGIA